MEYFPLCFIEEVCKRLQNISEIPNLLEVLKNTLKKHVLCRLVSEYPKTDAYKFKTISNTTTC